MCGRFSQNLGKDARAIILFRKMDILTTRIIPRFNIAPTQNVPVALHEAGAAPKMAELHWGLIPSWAKDASMGVRMINARAETVAEKPSFRHAFKKQRCLVPVSGFYEWLREGDAKTPYYFTPKNADTPMVFAGLWEFWKGHDEEIRSFSIITTEANATMAPIHDRMPVILPEETWTEWIDPGNDDHDRLLSLLKPAPDDLLTCWEVDRYVNNARNQGEKCIQPAASA